MQISKKSVIAAVMVQEAILKRTIRRTCMKNLMSIALKAWRREPLEVYTPHIAPPSDGLG